MGKCVRIRSSKQPSPPPAEAAAYLTLRSGRRVPVLAVAAAAAACSPRATGRCGHRGSPRRCGAEQAAKRACGSPWRKSAAASPRGRALVDGAKLCGGRLAETQVPSPQADSLRAAADGGCGDDDSFEPPKSPLDGDDDTLMVEVQHAKHESKGVAGQLPPAMEAEMEAFFAAAELAERRRFAEAYNYDVALDRPLEGRFEWAPVMST